MQKVCEESLRWVDGVLSVYRQVILSLGVLSSLGVPVPMPQCHLACQDANNTFESCVLLRLA